MTTMNQHFRMSMFILLLLFAIWLPVSKSAATVLLSLSWLVFISRAASNREFRREFIRLMNQPLLMPFFVLLAVALAGLLLTEKLSDGLGIVNKLASLPLVYLMAAVLMEASSDGERSPRVLANVLLAFIAGILILDVIGLMTYLGVVGHKRYVLPVAPLHVHHIWFANLNAVGLYAVASFFLFGKAPQDIRKRALLIVFTALSVFSLLVSISRTAWLGVIATGIVLTYIYAGKRKIFLTTLVVVIAGCFLAYRFIPLVHDRVTVGFTDISQYTEGARETSMGWRLLMWKAAVSMFLSNPLLGVGTGNYVLTMDRYIGSGAYPESLLQFNQPHNMYLFSLATNGILGLGALLFLFYRVFDVTLSGGVALQPHMQAFFLATAVAVHYLVAGLTDSLFNIFLLRYSFAFIMGICLHRRSGNAAVSR